MPKALDITNKKFGKLKAIRLSHIDKNGRHIWIFKCDCSKEKKIRKSHVIYGKIKTCSNHIKRGEESHLYKHGMSGKNFYERFKKMEDRCNNPKNKTYKNYGGRGIKSEWKSFEEFKKDMYESYVEYIKKYGQKRMTLERLDNNKNYCKKNCKWVDITINERNRRDSIFLTFNKQSKTIPEWAEILNKNVHTLYTRYRRKWKTNRILS